MDAPVLPRYHADPGTRMTIERETMTAGGQKVAGQGPRSVQRLEVALPVPLPQTFTYLHLPGVEPSSRVVEAGDLVEVVFGRRKHVVGLVVQADAPAPPQAPAEPAEGSAPAIRLRDITRVLPVEYRLVGERRRLADWLATYYALPLGEVVPLFHPPSPGTTVRQGRRAAPAGYPTVDGAVTHLTTAQQVAVDDGRQRLGGRTFSAVLLHGVTGSGKTEVYLTLIATALEMGRGALFLLPEIALTPQTLSRIAARFGNDVAAVHSGLSAGQRSRVHEQAARGETRVVVGPRSALFAPVRDLGLIVVDEEHESSYKQDEKPRYHARHAALVRGRECGALVVLGSATPDLESLANARDGRYGLWELPERMGVPLPEVAIVDVRGAASPDGVSPELDAAVSAALERREQVILFYNRRGFARSLQCAGCGTAAACPDCDIAVTYHLRPRRLLCHYCGHTRPVPTSCEECGHAAFLPSGAGTERLELHLQGRFPQARLLRLDRDTTSGRDSHHRILGAFARGEADILLGTQMVAKGHHFPGVSLVGVLAADDGLAMPDFRAAERSFQLLSQVAGRAGRAAQGQVILQTWQPEHPVIVAVASHDFRAFAAAELDVRRTLGYPPYRRLARVGIAARAQAEAAAAAAALGGALRDQFAGDAIVVLGPAPAVFERLMDRYRFQVLLKGDLPLRHKAWLAGCLRALAVSFPGVEVMLDIDPVSSY
ncbi:MAG: primosomal protein N' [bacterium]|nr:primosomal protein N' [bacterium]